MRKLLVRVAVVVLLSAVALSGIVLSKLSVAAQINPTAQQQTIDAVIVERFNQTATAQSVIDQIQTELAVTRSFVSTVDAAFAQAQTGTASSRSESIVVATSTRDPFEQETWTPFPTGTHTPAPTADFPTVEPITPPPTIEPFPTSQNGQQFRVGALPATIDPRMTGADFRIPLPNDVYQPFILINPIELDQAFITDESGAAYWVNGDETISLPEPFSSFGADSLENSDRLVSAAAWSPDGAAVAFVVDNPRRGDANDGVWWWEVGTGRAYQVMHNCRRNIRNCGDFVNTTGDPYINPPADQPEQPNSGWYAQSVSWSPDGTRILVRIRIGVDRRLAFTVVPATMDENWKRQRGDVCKYELSDWTANASAVLVAGRGPNDVPVLGRIQEPNMCSDFVLLSAEQISDLRSHPVMSVDGILGPVPDGVIAGSEYEAGQQLLVNSATGGVNLWVMPVPGYFHRWVYNGEYVRVIAGPYNFEGDRWWKIQTSEGTRGWVLGASINESFLIPVPR